MSYLNEYTAGVSVRRKTVLVIDAADLDRERLAVPLRREYRVLRAASGEAALSLMEREDVDIVVADAKLPGLSALELLRIVRENYPLAESILVAAASDLDGAVQAIKLGAYHYLAKSSDPDTLRATVAHASQRQELNRRVLTLRAEVQELGEREFIAGPSRSMRETLDMVQKVAHLSATVLILGESGTGKELLARLIHRASANAPGGGGTDRPFIAINLAAIPRELVESTLFGHERGAFTGALQQRIGKFELASGGTLFLDEIGDLRLDLQAKLLRAIQEGEIERVGGSKPIKTFFRLIAATNVDLERAVKDGTFREDLFYRLNVIPMRLPPLRERIEDLPELAQFFLNRYNARFHKQLKGIAQSTLRMLSHHWWPGNVRELENLIERVVATADGEWITDDDLPFEFLVAELDHEKTDEGLLDRALVTFERNFIVRALEKSGWNVTQTARYLGVPLSTIKFKMDRLEIREIARRIKGG
jgi:DNA-binding NtrC family response regulator